MGGVAIVILLRGPQKIPDITRASRRVKKEFADASKEMSSAITGALAKVTRGTTANQALGTSPTPSQTYSS